MINATIIKDLIKIKHPAIQELREQGFSLNDCIVLSKFALFFKNHEDALRMVNAINKQMYEYGPNSITARFVQHLTGENPVALLMVQSDGIRLMCYNPQTSNKKSAGQMYSINLKDILQAIFGNNDESEDACDKRCESVKCCDCSCGCSEDADDCGDDCENEEFAIERVLYNNNATIIFYTDGTKSVAVCDENDEFNPAAGFAIALCKKLVGNATFHAMLEDFAYDEYDRRRAEKNSCCGGKCSNNCGNDCDCIKYTDLDFVDVPDPEKKFAAKKTGEKAPAKKPATKKTATKKSAAKKTSSKTK